VVFSPKVKKPTLIISILRLYPVRKYLKQIW